MIRSTITTVPIICYVCIFYDSNVNLAYLYDRYDVPCHFRLNAFYRPGCIARSDSCYVSILQRGPTHGKKHLLVVEAHLSFYTLKPRKQPVLRTKTHLDTSDLSRIISDTSLLSQLS